jgi:large repetitive protein
MPKASALFSAIFLCVALATGSEAQTVRQPAITKTVDPGATVVLQGSKHQLVQPRFDVGAVDPGLKMNRVIVALAAPQSVEDELQAFLSRQQDKTSADYHHWLTPDEFGQKFGPALQDIATVKGWLEQQGLQVTSIAKSGLWMEVSGTSGQIEHAFQTQMRQFQVNGEAHIANATDISIPAAVALVVRGVVSLHNFFKKPLASKPVMVKANGNGTYSAISPSATNTAGLHALSPGDYAKIYNMNPIFSGGVDGSGVKIGLVARSDVNQNDYLGFRNAMNLPIASVETTLTQLPDPGFDSNSGDSVEATLDAEWAGALATGAVVDLIVSASTVTTDGVDLSSAYAVDNNLVDILSVSFGECEADLGPAENVFYNSIWQQAAAQGMSVFVSTGDSGAAGCDNPNLSGPATGGSGVNGVASTPFNTAVGGTQFADGNSPSAFWSATNSTGLISANGYIPEAVWNESCNPNTLGSPCAGKSFSIFAGSGGQSGIYPKPVWQTGFPAADSSRDIPDVSLTAAIHDGYLICFNDSCAFGNLSIIGGTSASSPSFAGIMALVDQTLGGRQGLANYTLYRLAKGPSASCSSSARTNPLTPAPAGCIFNDVTTGNNSVPGQAGFNAAAGYDLATGLGSVNVANLINNWKVLSAGAVTTTTLSSALGSTISVAHGTPVPLTINVTNPSTPAPSGAVALFSSANGTAAVDSVALTASSSTTGTFTGNISDLPGGAYSLTAHFPGDSLTAPSSSTPLSVTISPEASTTTLRAFGINTQGAPVPATSFSYGSFINLHASVAGTSGKGTPSGRITYQDSTSGESLGIAQLNARDEAEFFLFPNEPIPAPLTVGPHTLTASYGGDTSFNAGAPGSLSVIITKANPTVEFVITDNFLATQTNTVLLGISASGPILPAGTVEVLDGGVSTGPPVQVISGEARVPITIANEGQHFLTANYSGDTTYNATISPAQTITVLPPFQISGSVNAIVTAGQTATFALNVGSIATGFNGTVALSCSGAPVGTTCSIDPSSVSISPTTPGDIVVSVATTTSAALHTPFRGLPIFFGMLFAIAISWKSGRKQCWQMGLVAVMVVAMSSCGGGSSSVPVPTPPPTTQSTIVVTGTSGTHVSTVNLSLTIRH